MDKRGQSEVLTTMLLFELIIGVLIATILMYAVLNINNTSNFSKEYAKQNLFLTEETVKSLSGDLDMKFNTGGWCLTDDKQFVQGTNCWVQITKTGDEVKAQRYEKK